VARPPLFTVLMPTHYRPDIIGLAIQSVLDQTEPDFELLVVGDGPWPGTEEAVRAFDDPRIRWLKLPKAPNFGYANRNRALAEGRGELVVFDAARRVTGGQNRAGGLRRAHPPSRLGGRSPPRRHRRGQPRRP
jgi:GT2 family glycosyltransferase